MSPQTHSWGPAAEVEREQGWLVQHQRAWYQLRGRAGSGTAGRVQHVLTVLPEKSGF